MPCGIRFPLDLFFLAIPFPPPGDIQSDIRKSTESEPSSKFISRAHFFRETTLDRVHVERSARG
jgi:hypothetical protein